MAIFYHVSTNLDHSGYFEPRIPSTRHMGLEDAKTPRISVSTSIEKCLSAIPNGGAYLDELNDTQRGYYLVFRIDTEKLGITEEQIITSNSLYEDDRVQDAFVTEEHWITIPFGVPQEDQYLIHLYSWREEAFDDVPASFMKRVEEEFEGDIETAWEELFPHESMPCGVSICCLDYKEEKLRKGAKIELNTTWRGEANLLKEFAEENDFPVEIIPDDISPMLIAIEDVNIRPIIFYHQHLVERYV